MTYDNRMNTSVLTSITKERIHSFIFPYDGVMIYMCPIIYYAKWIDINIKPVYFNVNKILERFQIVV